jgi:hypothetical protein
MTTLRWAWVGLVGCCGAIAPALALPTSEPAPGRYACVAGPQGWFQSGMSPVFTIEVLPSSRFHIENLKGLAGEGGIEAGAWPGSEPSLDALFDKGSAVVLRQDDRQPLLMGLYGERGGARTWLLRLKAIGNAYVRCGDEPVRPGGPAGAGKPAEAPPAVPSQERRSGSDRRGVDFPTPPVRLPPGARLGGRFEPGRYACSVSLPQGAARPIASVVDFHANGEWRRPKAREGESGHYAAIPDTGRFDAFEPFLGNNTYHPDDEYAVYFRAASGVSQLYGRRASGNSVRETRCERTGDVQGPAPAEVARQAQETRDAAQARRAAEAAELGRRNLQPPPPGRTRWQGLYARESFQQKQRVDPGPYGGFSRLVIDTTSRWDFLEFLPDGHVYLGLRPPQVLCDQPAVKDNGQPLCTTYSVDRGRLRIGHDDRGPVSRAEGGRSIQLGREDRYAAVPPLTPARLAGAYQASSCHGALCEKSSWVFGVDGTFGADGLSQGFGTGAGPAGQPMPQGWAHNRQVEGRYRIEGQGLWLTDGEGQSGALAVFLHPPKDRVLNIGGREFSRKNGKD